MPQSRSDFLKNQIDEALEQADTAWWEWDVRKNRVDFNDLKATMLGYSVEDFADAGYQAFTDLLHSDDYERTMDAMRRHLDGRAPLYQIDYRIRRADGTYTWFMDRGYIIERDADGAPELLRGIVFDMGADHAAGEVDERVVTALRNMLPTAEGLSEETNAGLMTVCMVCKRIRLPEHGWTTITERLQDIVPGLVSHGLCQECAEVMYPEYRRLRE